jgi:hypothetical protein
MNGNELTSNVLKQQRHQSVVNEKTVERMITLKRSESIARNHPTVFNSTQRIGTESPNNQAEARIVQLNQLQQKLNAFTDQ